MISVINASGTEAERKKIAKSIVMGSLRTGREIRTEEFEFSNLIQRDATRRIFGEIPKTSEELEKVRQNAMLIIVNSGTRYTEEDKVYARLFLYFLGRGLPTDKFFLPKRETEKAVSRVLRTARLGYSFNKKDDEELV